ncbi:MAG: sugar phosphate isomerase/epimerase family protein [Kiritimatiellia bacterium]
MNRREFLAAGAVAGLAAAIPAKGAECCGGAMPKLTPPAQPAQLNLCLQWGLIPVQDDVNAKLDFLEKNGYQAVEIPSGIDWLRTKGLQVAESLKTRRLFLATACGPSQFDRLDKAKNDAEVEKFMPVLELLGEMKSVGLIICPARGNPEMGLKELREDFVTNTGKRLAAKAAACGTSIVLEPLQRHETPFLRQVSDGARMAQEIGAGCSVMGDFWHMSKEEPNFFGAFVSAGKLLTHVHIASLRRRKIPGSDGEADNYVDGFKGLKFLGYRGAVSVEAGFVEKGRDAKNKPIWPSNEEKQATLAGMCRMLREQWEQA